MSLLKEVKQDRLEKVMELLQGPQNLNQVDSKTGNSLLHLAVNNLSEDVLKMLLSLDTKPDLNILNQEGLTPLQTAVSQNFREGVEELLKAGAEVDFVSEEGRTALHYAAEENLEDIAKVLINKKANVNAKCDQGTPLHIATQSVADEVGYLLLGNKKTDFSETDEDGNTFLHASIECGAYNIFQKFFGDYDNGVYDNIVKMSDLLNIVNNDGNNILHQAELAQKTSISQFLRQNAEKYGLDINVKNKEGLSADDCKEYHKIKQREQEEQKKQDKIQQAEAKKVRKEEREALEQMKKEEAAQMRRQEEEELEEAKKIAIQSQQKGKCVTLLVVAVLVGAMFLLLKWGIDKKKDDVMDL